MAVKVYVVTSGCYSDYQIRAIFSDKKKAKAYAKLHSTSRFSADAWDVEEWTVDDTAPTALIAKGIRPWSVAFLRPIPLTSGRNRVPYVNPVDEMQEHRLEQGGAWGERYDYWVIYVEAANEKDAIKIAAEKHAQLEAERLSIA